MAFTLLISALRVGCAETGAVELELPDDPFDVTRIDVSNAPTLVTLNKVRHNYRSHYVYRFTLIVLAEPWFTVIVT